VAKKFSIRNIFNFLKKSRKEDTKMSHHHGRHKVHIHAWTPHELISQEVIFESFELAFEFGAKFNSDNAGSVVKVYDGSGQIVHAFDQSVSDTYA